MIKSDDHKQNEHIDGRQFFILGLIFLSSISSLILVYLFFPQVDAYVYRFHFSRWIMSRFSSEKQAFKLPKTMDDAKFLGNVLYKYSEHHRYIIMIAFFLTYIL